MVSLVLEHGMQAAGEQDAMVKVMQWPSREAAEGFLAGPSLVQASIRAGVIGEPRVTFWDTVQTTEF